MDWGKYIEIDETNESERTELSTGDIVIVGKIKGGHQTKAGQLMEGDVSKYMPCLMHLVFRVGGQQMPAEWFEELDAIDFSTLQDVVTKRTIPNPTSAAKN